MRTGADDDERAAPPAVFDARVFASPFTTFSAAASITQSHAWIGRRAATKAARRAIVAICRENAVYTTTPIRYTASTAAKRLRHGGADMPRRTRHDATPHAAYYYAEKVRASRIFHAFAALSVGVVYPLPLQHRRYTTATEGLYRHLTCPC